MEPKRLLTNEEALGLALLFDRHKEPLIHGAIRVIFGEAGIEWNATKIAEAEKRLVEQAWATIEASRSSLVEPLKEYKLRTEAYRKALDRAFALDGRSQEGRAASAARHEALKIMIRAEGALEDALEKQEEYER